MDMLGKTPHNMMYIEMDFSIFHRNMKIVQEIF